METVGGVLLYCQTMLRVTQNDFWNSNFGFVILYNKFNFELEKNHSSELEKVGKDVIQKPPILRNKGMCIEIVTG